MEGVPRIPMMSFPMRRSADTPHFKSRLKSFISNHYNEDPESYANEIHELESLRASAVHVSKDYSGCSTLKKYFCQLNFLKSRFPMNEGGTCAVSFSWYDVFSDNVHGWSDVDFEMSCVLYNIGALHSELGALDNRQTADGMKTSCTHFQCAAWAFSHLRNNYQKYFTPDISPDMLNILNNVCLAQAQECILEKSLIDNRKSTITAKVALQIVEYYSTALKIIDGMLKDAAQYSDKLIKAVKKWRKLVELKVQYYNCIAYLYRGMQAEDQGKWGERVTMYKAAAEKLGECQKLAKNMEKTDPIHDTIQFTVDVVGGKVAIAEKENEFIYHEKVPELETVMSDVKAVSLVKGIQFKFDDPQVAGPDIFGRLVPMEAHEASSLYSEEKAKILRTYSRKIEEKNEALEKFVIPLQLDQLELHDSEKIPQELIDCCAGLSVNQDVVKRLSELMAKLSSLFHDVEANLEEIQDHLADQEKREKEYQEVVGKRPPNNIINEINREFQKYQSAQAVAAESNKTLHEAMMTHVANLNILMKPLPDVMNHIPKFDELEKNEEALERMKKLAGKVSEMRKQREMLESQLRDSILNDDITKSLVVKKDEDLETVFKEELQKHDKITQLLDQNLLAQENIIRALTEANAEYAETRKATVEMKRKRDAAIQSLISSYEAYDELTSKCNKGIEFYTKLSANVEKLLQRMRSVCKVQNEERDINMERIIRKAQPPGGLPGGGSVGYGANMMTPTAGGGFVPYQNPGSGGFPPVSGTNSHPSAAYPTSGSPTAMPKPSAGGHLKLKDYLAMKKEGQTAAELAAKMNNLTGGGGNLGHNQTPPPPQQMYDPASGQQQLQHPMVSSTPPPTNNNPIGVRPAPVGSEDSKEFGKDSTYGGYPYQQPQAPVNNYNNYYNSQAQPHQPASTVSGFYAQQQQHESPLGYRAGPGPEISHQSHIPNASGYPPQSQPNQTGYASAPASVPNNSVPNQQQQPYPSAPIQNHGMMTPYTPDQSGYHSGAAMAMNTSYSSPVYSRQYPPKSTEMSAAYSTSYGIPLSYSGMTSTNQNTYSTAPAAQYPASVTSPASASVPSEAPKPSMAPSAVNASQASYYSGVYHPTANTVTNATFSTGTIATPSTLPPPSAQQQQQQTVPQSQYQQQPPSLQQQPLPQPQYQSQQHQPTQGPSSNVSAPPAVPPTVPTPPLHQPQQQQQPPSSIPAADTTDYSKTSFLAQYVRQNQGFLSSSSTQQPSSLGTFPSSVNYNTNMPSYSQQPPTDTNPAYSQGYTSGQYGSQPNQPNTQYPGYVATPPPPPPTQQQQQQPQQQWQAPQSQPLPPHQNQNPAQGQHQTYSANYPQNSQSQQQHQQQQQQYQPAQYVTPQQPQQQTGHYYTPPPGSTAAPPQPQQQTYPAQPQTQPQYQNQQVPYQNQSQSQPQQPPPPAPAPVQSTQPQPKSAGGSNLDLLSDIDFNVMPAVEPLAPSPAHAANQNQDSDNDHQITTISPAKSATASSVSSSSSSSLHPDTTTLAPSQVKTNVSTVADQPASNQIPSLLHKLTVSNGVVSNSPSSKGNNVSNNSKVVVDPFLDPVALEKFTFEVEKFENTVEGLAKKSLNGPTLRLDLKWKDVVDIQNATSVKRSISVARCYPMKNRFPDIMPYDQTRVPIPDTKDDYINASFVNDLSQSSYPLIATQAPLPATMADFWHMIWQHYIETVVCLCADVDLKDHIYWPKEKGAALEYGVLKIVLQTRNLKTHYVERILSVSHRDLKQSRVVVHLQFTGWPGNTFPVSPGPLLAFVSEASSYYQQQRNRSRPVVVHCLSGVGKTGVFCVLSAAIREINAGHGIPDLVQIAGLASEGRKGIMNDKEYLRFAYHSLLYYCQDILMKHGILSAKPTFEEKPKKSHIRHPSQDFLQEISLSKLIGEQNLKSKSGSTTTTASDIPSTSTPNSPLRSNNNNKSNSTSGDGPPRQQRSSSLADTSAKPKLSYHDVPESLTNIDPTTFRINSSASEPDTASLKKQAFESNKGSLFERKSAVDEEAASKDPLSSLDPLWTMKK